ncbi:MAG: Txe/YoeB family addiction module toxin [Bacteroides sp.]|nr:Txe/YoeB family addiction module toxin [Bacteroides sp.]
MMYAIQFDPKVEKVITKWKKSNPILFKKLRNVLNDIMKHPRTGIGHPEALIGGSDILYSRRITAHDRIIYKIHDEEIFVLVIEVEGHYGDK